MRKKKLEKNAKKSLAVFDIDGTIMFIRATLLPNCAALTYSWPSPVRRLRLCANSIVFGKVMEVDSRGRYAGHTVVEPVYGKRETLEAFVDAHHISLNDSIALGDTESDIPMLSMVERPICFNPNSVLYDDAKKRKWEIVVERKDVIYEL